MQVPGHRQARRMTRMPAVSELQQWLDLVYPADPSRAERYHVGVLPAGGGGWYGQAYPREQVPAAVQAAELTAPAGVYLGACTFRPEAGNSRKGADTAWCYGMWSDLDIAGPGHKHDASKYEGRGLPPDEQSARLIVAVSGLPEPTAWVHSGGGLYAWWLLDTPTVAGDCGELARAWQNALGAGAKALGWHYGTGVGDLARVLRVPGTVNRKVPSDPRPCRLLSADGPRYSLAELRQAVTALAQPAEPPPAAPDPFDPPARRTGHGPSPLDDFNARADWGELLTSFGWRHVYRGDDGLDHWRHPNASHPTSATTGRRPAGGDTMKCFSDSAGLPTEGTLSKAFVWAALTQRTEAPDMARAVTQLRAAGYGEQQPPIAVPAGGPAGDLGDGLNLDGHQQTAYDWDVTNPAEAAARLRANIGRGELAGLFDRAGGIVFIAREGDAGYVPPARDDQHDGPAQVCRVNAAGLAAYIDARYRCFRWVKSGENLESRPALFPTEAARRIVDLPDPTLRPQLRRLAGVTHTPVARADGSILDTPGYDPATRLYYLPDPGLVVPAVPARPTVEQVKAAVGLLDEMTDGFPWKSEHDRAGYYGFLLTPLLRNITPPPYKLTIFDAPQQGTGKTLLGELGRILHGGVLRGGVQHGDDEEVRKTVTTILARTTGPVVIFDNLTGTLDSPVLAGLLTSAEWTDRLLGGNDEVRALNDRVWCATANNLAVGVDMLRRTIWVGIDAQTPRPQDRTGFAIADLPGWARARRGELLHALLILIRAWVVGGRPTRPARTSDSFAVWVQAVDGILGHAGVPGRFADPSTERQEAGEQDDEWADFLRAVHEVFGERTWTVKDLLDLVPRPGIHTLVPTGNPFDPPPARIPLDALPGALADKAAQSARGVSAVAVSLGRWLTNRDGRFVGELCCRSAGHDGNHKRLWRIGRLRPDSSISISGVAGVTGVVSGHLSARPPDSILVPAQVYPRDRPQTTPVTPATPGAAAGSVSARPPACTVCGHPVDPAAGTTHPSCTPAAA
jgi:hypothetical protein